MMGTQNTSAQLFYDFCLEERVSADHLPRKLDHFLDFNNIRE
ncbi:hypothetical protein PsAD26_03385 [Pseudovibrio sp. Ad26]|nr:hypothetical protein PsAD26_03385 [Pseudovibrio sp. Ad26]